MQQATPHEVKHFLDARPFSLSHPGAIELRDLLAAAYWTSTSARQIADRAGMVLDVIDFAQPMIHVWYGILQAAAAQGKLRAIVACTLEDPRIREFYERLRELQDAVPVVDPEGSANFAWVDCKPKTGEEIQIEARSTLFSIAFLSRALEVAPAVVRLRICRTSGRYHGTGFLIADGLILTNHHVLYDSNGAAATAVEVWFGYELDAEGTVQPHDDYTGDVASVEGDHDLDWAIVRLVEPLRKPYPTLTLSPKLPAEIDGRVCIIQHPNGEPKQIALHHNDVRHVDARVVHYRTDTERGSSGSPVFNEHWEVVALHHCWVEAGLLAGRRIFRNEGIRIERVAESIARKGIAL